ncbi:MAG: tRNA (adenosine(37)-N6)-threonylcarbamoyltransferase complex ATPase subunit type 1 TsaE, partial [Yaniella sp.]|nr:tRNA (adenosine(37)-N6)-threonylcarbamoyltransferase complex ATPase subunit type 1 TsaE [Yaniella sp.]
MEYTADLADLAATKNFALAVANQLQAGDVIILTGELGAGKTTFTQGLARGLGITAPITSPTFVLA